MKSIKSKILRFAVAAASLGIFSMSGANAGIAEDAFTAWNNAFLRESNGRIFYSKYLSKAESSGTWSFALNIVVAQDVYEHTHDPQTRQLIVRLLDSFMAENNGDWKNLTWNDDIAWMSLGILRGYQLTGNQKYLDQAIYAWNMAYNRGWDDVGGGGIWEEMDSKFSKCSLSNNPMVITGVLLYQMTGDGAYLTKSESIYAWSRQYLFRSTGQVDECMAFPPGQPAELQTSANAYNAGSFSQAANDLYRVTGKTNYRDDAQLAIDYYIGRGAILYNDGERDAQWAYHLIYGINQFCTMTNTCAKYSGWLQANANAAWANRNSINITGNNWTKVFAVADPDAMQTSSAVAIWQLLPDTSTVSAFTGSYQIQNVGSQLALSVDGASKAASAAVVQSPFKGGKESLWKLEAIGNGYYRIKNVNSGMLLNVTAASSKTGAAVVQWKKQGLEAGNDQWKPVRNADGTYSFFNLSSHMALDIPGGSTAAGAKLQQWAADETDAQKFNLIPKAAASLVGAQSQRCLDAPLATNGTQALIWDCNGGVNQAWVHRSNGTLEAHGKCLDVFNASTTSGSAVGLWDCNGGANQQWQMKADGSIVNVQSGLCLDVSGGGTTNNTPVVTWSCTATANQKWTRH